MSLRMSQSKGEISFYKSQDPLHKLIQDKDWIKAVKFIKDPNNAQSLNNPESESNPETPIFKAIEQGQHKLVKALFEVGIDPNIQYIDKTNTQDIQKPIILHLLKHIPVIGWDETKKLLDLMLQKNSNKLDSLLGHFASEAVSICFTCMQDVDKNQKEKERSHVEKNNKSYYDALAFLQNKGLVITKTQYKEGNVIAHLIKFANKTAIKNLLKLAYNEKKSVKLSDLFNSREITQIKLAKDKNCRIGFENLQEDQKRYLKINNTKYPLTMSDKSDDYSQAIIDIHITKSNFFAVFLLSQGSEMPVWLKNVIHLANEDLYSENTKRQLSNIITFFRELATTDLGNQTATIAQSKHPITQQFTLIENFCKEIEKELKPIAQKVFQAKRQGNDPKEVLNFKEKGEYLINSSTDLFAQKIFEWLLLSIDAIRRLPINLLPKNPNESNNFTKALSHLLNFIAQEVFSSKSRSELNKKVDNYTIGFKNHESRIKAEGYFNEIDTVIGKLAVEQKTEKSYKAAQICRSGAFSANDTLDQQMEKATKTLNEYISLGASKLTQLFKDDNVLLNLLWALMSNLDKKGNGNKGFFVWKDIFEHLLNNNIINIQETKINNKPLLLVTAENFSNKYLLEFLLTYVDSTPSEKSENSEDTEIKSLLYGNEDNTSTNFGPPQHPGVLFGYLDILMKDDKSYHRIAHNKMQTAMAFMKWIAKRKFSPLNIENNPHKEFTSVLTDFISLYETLKTFLDKRGLQRLQKDIKLTKDRRQSSFLQEALKDTADKIGLGDSRLVIRFAEWYHTTVTTFSNMPESALNIKNIRLFHFIMKQIFTELKEQFENEKSNPKQYCGIKWENFETTEGLQNLLNNIEQNIDKISKILNKENIPNSNLKQKPSKYPDDFSGKSVLLGDLHGNAALLLNFLIKVGVADLTSEDYKAFYELSDKPLTSESKEKINGLISKIQWNPKNVWLITLLGDILADRGQNDWITLRLLESMNKAGVNYQIVFGNHDLEFYRNALPFEANHSLKQPKSVFNYCDSLKALSQSLNDNIVNEEEVIALYKNAYLNKVQLIPFHIEGLINFDHYPLFNLITEINHAFATGLKDEHDNSLKQALKFDDTQVSSGDKPIIKHKNTLLKLLWYRAKKTIECEMQSNTSQSLYLMAHSGALSTDVETLTEQLFEIATIVKVDLKQFDKSNIQKSLSQFDITFIHGHNRTPSSEKHISFDNSLGKQNGTSEKFKNDSGNLVFGVIHSPNQQKLNFSRQSAPTHNFNLYPAAPSNSNSNSNSNSLQQLQEAMDELAKTENKRPTKQ